MPDLLGWVRFVAAVTFRPQRTAHRAIQFADEVSARLVRVKADRDAAWEQLREEREVFDLREAQRRRYVRALCAIRDAAPITSTVHRLADAALRGEEHGD